jgi:membrane associated rhomboid family serine protease
MFNDSYRPSGFGYLPVVTKNIIIINVILFLAKFAFERLNIRLDDYLGLHYHLSPVFKPHQFITYIFMHADVMHIFFNMMGVYIFGQVLESVWGAKRFLIFYLLTGLGAALPEYAVLHYNITAVIIGASGSLFGLMGGFAMLFPNRYLYLLFFPPVKAKWFVIGYGIIELFSGITDNPGDNTAHFAHVGGLLVGVLIILYWRRFNRNFY